MNQEDIWNLVAKKLSGEASPEELDQLENLLRKNPGLHYPLQVIIDLWKHKPHYSRQAADGAFERHVARMSAMNPDMNPERTSVEKTSLLASVDLPVRKKRNIKIIYSGLVIIILAMSAVIIRYVIHGSTKP
jgi:hypothetical protein